MRVGAYEVEVIAAWYMCSTKAICRCILDLYENNAT